MEHLDLSNYLDSHITLSSEGYFLPLGNTFKHNLVDTEYQAAIIGVPSDGDLFNIGTNMAPDAIRKQLYELSGDFHLRIADLGNLKCGKTHQDVLCALKEVVRQLIENSIIPIILGGTQELTIALSNAIKGILSKQRVSVIDCKIDLSENIEILSAHNYLHWLINNDNVESISLIGLQNYYCADWQKKALKQKNGWIKRISDISNHISNIEPILRDSDLFSFDMSAIRQAEAPGRAYSIPNGMNGIEACQLAHYAGLSDSILVYGLFGFNPSFDNSDQSAALAAQIIWHILKGIENRYNDYPKCEITEYQKYLIHPQIEGDKPITFYCNISNNRWWIIIPTLTGERIFACSYDDYLCLNNGSLPDIWMNNYLQ